MEYETNEQSVNTVEVAEPQIESQTTDVQDTSANPSEVAEPNLVQDAETNAHYAEQRRKQELDEYRSKAESYEQNLNRIAQLQGFASNDELIQAIEEAEQQRERQKYEDAGIDPDQFNQLLENHPDIQRAREQERLNAEANELFSEFPDLKPEQIPVEVFQMQETRRLQGQPMSLLDAYLRSTYKNLGQQKEQEAIQKLQQNQTTSTGSLSGGDVEHNTSISKMSSADFAALQQKVMRGEKVEF